LKGIGKDRLDTILPDAIEQTVAHRCRLEGVNGFS
jgi:hypothetical protein